MRFWDSSAIVPLLVQETSSATFLDILKAAPDDIVVWWGSSTECISALCRREREGAFSSRQISTALARLHQLQDAWTEVEPTERIRRTAARFLRVHPLRAADSFQLSAAWALCADDVSSVEFVTLDVCLAKAASKEGFRVIGVMQ